MYLCDSRGLILLQLLMPYTFIFLFLLSTLYSPISFLCDSVKQKLELEIINEMIYREKKMH